MPRPDSRYSGFFLVRRLFTNRKEKKLNKLVNAIALELIFQRKAASFLTSLQSICAELSLFCIKITI